MRKAAQFKARPVPDYHALNAASVRAARVDGHAPSDAGLRRQPSLRRSLTPPRAAPPSLPRPTRPTDWTDRPASLLPPLDRALRPAVAPPKHDQSRPAPAPRPLTVPSYDGPSVDRHQAAVSRRLEQLEREMAAEKQKFSSFVARPVPKSLHQPEMLLRKSEKPLTQVEDVALASDERAVRRAAFDAEMRRREEEAERLKQEKEEEQRR